MKRKPMASRTMKARIQPGSLRAESSSVKPSRILDGILALLDAYAKNFPGDFVEGGAVFSLEVDRGVDVGEGFPGVEGGRRRGGFEFVEGAERLSAGRRGGVVVAVDDVSAGRKHPNL